MSNLFWRFLRSSLVIKVFTTVIYFGGKKKSRKLLTFINEIGLWEFIGKTNKRYSSIDLTKNSH